MLSVLGGTVFGSTGFSAFIARLLFLMILNSAAASTQTTLLPTARTTLSKAVYKALPDSFAKISPRFLTPTVSTITMGAVSIAIYIPFNYISQGNPIADALTALGLYIALVGGIFIIAFFSTLVGLIAGIYMRFVSPAFFRGQPQPWAITGVAATRSSEPVLSQRACGYRFAIHRPDCCKCRCRLGLAKWRS